MIRLLAHVDGYWRKILRLAGEDLTDARLGGRPG